MSETKIKGRQLSSSPAFSATRGGSSQALSSGVFTKIQFGTEEFDVTGDYDNVTNYRFTPSVAGKYLVIVAVTIVTPSAGKWFYSSVYKNGGEYKSKEQRYHGTGEQNIIVTAIVDMNGTTDYVEGWSWSNEVTPVISGNVKYTYFQASLLK